LRSSVIRARRSDGSLPHKSELAVMDTYQLAVSGTRRHAERSGGSKKFTPRAAIAT
jgi:hypothetical protein